MTVSPAPGDALLVDRGVDRMAWTGGGVLVWGVRRPNGNVTLRSAPAGAPAAAETVADDVRSWWIAGDAIAWVGGWTVLSGTGTLGAVVAGTNRPATMAAGVVPDVGAASAGGAVALAWVEVAAGAADRRQGALHLGGGLVAGAAVDDRVAPRAGFAFSPDARAVAYARDWRDPVAAGSASPQPGSGEVRVAFLDGTPPVTVAAAGSMQRVAWGAGAVAAVAAYDAASNIGRLEVRALPGGALLQALERVSPTWFGFGAEGAEVAAIRNWDDALQRGELVLQPVAAGAPPVVVATGATSFLAPARQRLVYAVRGGGRDGLWLH